MDAPYPVRAGLHADLTSSQVHDTNPMINFDPPHDTPPMLPADASMAANSSISDAMSPTTKEVKKGATKLKHFGTGIPTRNNSMEFGEEHAGDGEEVEGGGLGKVNEFDLAAYSKEELSLSTKKRVMARMFAAFDVTQQGFLTIEQLKELCSYVGKSASAEEMRAMFDELQGVDKKVTFDNFWTWWLNRPRSTVTDTAFSLVSADFSVPYHQQQLKIREEGQIFTPSYRIKYYFKDLETSYLRQVSPWHDIPLFVRDPVRTKPEHIHANRYNFICEIPKWTRAKFEIATGEAYNPIKQDIKNGLPRFYKHGDMMWNYGAMPQTWESTEVIFEDGVSGDNDPIDAVEIGMRQCRVGEVHPVRILGVLGMIDDGQMDWKLIVISVNDPITRFLKDINDVPKYLPGCLDALREWFRVYKICQGGVENKFAFDGEFKDKEYAMKIVHESHYMWENLRKIKGKEKV